MPHNPPPSGPWAAPLPTFDRDPRRRSDLAEQFTIAEFTGGPAAHVEVIEIAILVPALGLADELL